VRLISAASKPVRVFLFKRPFVDAFHLRLAIGMSLLQCDVQVLERADQGMRTACAIAKCGPPLPGLVLVEDEGGGEAASFERRLRRSEIGDLPLAVLGDGADPAAERRAISEGADGFISLPIRASELARMGRDLARFWADHRSRAESGDTSAA
jgi:CheY-like chemotaxis protein